jgi:hypothetical protein
LELRFDGVVALLEQGSEIAAARVVYGDVDAPERTQRRLDDGLGCEWFGNVERQRLEWRGIRLLAGRRDARRAAAGISALLRLRGLHRCRNWHR